MGSLSRQDVRDLVDQYGKLIGDQYGDLVVQCDTLITTALFKALRVFHSRQVYCPLCEDHLDIYAARFVRIEACLQGHANQLLTFTVCNDRDSCRLKAAVKACEV